MTMMGSQPRQPSELNSISLPSQLNSRSSELEATSSQSSISRIQNGFKKFSLARRKHASSDEDLWGAYGLNLLYDPPDPLIDLIFVHGLRGGSTKTWCKGDDMRLFWPQAWLPREQDLQNARVHSFGYNADWADTKETKLDLHDFGRALLTEMNTSPFLRRSRETPILLIGHSMGGIVIKKAYILAQQDPTAHFLANRIQGMFFLATPHKGSDSAKLLNNILRASTVLSSRQYISEIFKGSPSLQTINDEFRMFTDNVQIWSFYETLKTRTSPATSVLIVDRDSAVLGYKGEKAQPLNADHRNICKFDSPKDPNYVTIRNSLSKAVEDLLGDVFLNRTEESKTQMRDIETFLMISYNSEDDLITAEASKTEGTCEWITSVDSFEGWRDSLAEEPMLYWLTGEPGSGKTVLATHIIRHLQNMGADVSYHFFQYGRRSHQTISGFLRQIAYQMALRHPSVRQSLHKIQEIGMVFDKEDERTIWRKVFVNEIFNSPLHSTQYWVVDGLDECIDGPKLFGLITKFELSFPIRLCFVTRRRPDLDRHFSRFDRTLFAHHIDTDRTLKDIGAYIRDNATMLPVNEDEYDSLIERIVRKSRGIFLWAKFALEELAKVYSDESVDEVLDEMPEGMASIYFTILQMMATNTREIKLTKAILTWAVCGVRNLNVLELRAALKLDLATNIRSVERSVEGLCGQLLRIDSKTGTIHVIHATVRDFLLDHELQSPLAIHKDKGHHRLAVVCLQYLVSEEMRPPRHRSLVQVQSRTTSAFADYACTLFSDHIIKVSAQSDEVLTLLDRFFRTNVLSWIEFVARKKRDLFYVIRAARNLKQYLERRVKCITSPLDEQYKFIEHWTSDLIRIMSKFSRNLVNFPSTIFYHVAPLCPVDSAMFLQFNSPQGGFKLSGTNHIGWDDCVSYIDYRGVRALSLAVGDNLFAIGQRTGHIKVYDSATCQEKTAIAHGEPVRFLKFNSSGQRLLASGTRRLTMFNVVGEPLWTYNHQDPVVAGRFSANDDTVTVVTSRSSVLHFSASNGVVLPGQYLGKEDCKQLKKATPRAILHADISPDMAIMAIAYRGSPGRPVQLWSLEKDISIGACWFKRDTAGLACTPISDVLFNRNPAVELLAVATQDGELAVFDPWTRREIVSVSGEAYILACTPDGRTLATGDMRGSVKLWDFDTLTLLYCIKSDDYEVRSLAFSTDGFRLYDIREAKTKVWEPSALVRKSLSDESSISESIAQPATVIDRSQEVTEIMSLTSMGSEQFGLVGREDGSVVLFHTSSAKFQNTLYSHRRHAMVTRVTWSVGGYVATADSSGIIQVWSTSKGDGNMMEAGRKVLGVKIMSSVRDLQLSPSGSKLLVREAASDSIYWIPSSTVESAPDNSIIEGPDILDRTWAWLPNPITGFDIIMIGDSALYLYETCDTARRISLKAKVTLVSHRGHPVPPGQRLLFTESSRFLAVELEKSQQEDSPKLLVYYLEHILHETETTPESALGKPQPLLCLLHRTIRMFIGWDNETLVYLDTELWICSIEMSSIKSGDIRSYTRRRHLFIPFELIGSSNGIAPVLVSGTSIVFPRQGFLAVIENAVSTVFMTDEVVVDK
ncbi:hypothetical protein F5B22DRAFT_571235 [Xylaria bambusicola]|uniref:uncharacterized protein n=1 Tax=Xylaria bambusicola TaxID=326684 RepID=UPI0020088C97|nr:uncharacterized protein F5B22DRAFT_571235 [Xylaria bambusicola]KAI0521378.1 hypothetical protein F5B22DRAFT_571235 [Xylaria bambusicola]